MSSVLRSFASLYCQKLRSTTRLGAVAAPSRSRTVDRPRFLASGGADGARPPAALRPRCQEQDRKPLFFTWARLAIGSVLAAAAPFLHSKWASFLRLQSEVEMAKDAAEVAAEVVEKAAAATEKASSEVVEEAHLAQDIIHKVDEIEEDVKAMIGPFVDRGEHGKAQHSNHFGK